MTAIPATLSTHLFVDRASLPPEVQAQIVDALTIANPDKPIALREMLYGAHSMPDYIELFENIGDMIKIPRGFASSFVNGMTASGLEISWTDQRTSIAAREVLMPIVLDDYQEIACGAFLAAQGGMVSAPTGAGKTAISLEVIRRSGQRAIVIVEKSSLGKQWVKAAREMLGADAGYIGEGRWEERDLTIALRQSLWAARNDRQRMARIGSGPRGSTFWERWGMVLLDEAHHAPADTMVDLMQRFPAAIRGGVSATPDRDPLTFPIAEVVLGPVVSETSFQEAEARLIRPTIEVVPTEFVFDDYQPTRCEKVYSEELGRKVTKTIRNNYGEMMAALINDQDRNELICDRVMDQAVHLGRKCLIVSSRRDHLEILRDMLMTMMPVFESEFPEIKRPLVLTLFGGASGEDATAYKEMIESSSDMQGTILLSTVADEGLDIPILDRIFLVFPSRKAGATKQKVGRVTRRHPRKERAIVYDFMDGYMDLLRDQFRERRQLFYNAEGFEVTMEKEET